MINTKQLAILCLLQSICLLGCDGHGYGAMFDLEQSSDENQYVTPTGGDDEYCYHESIQNISTSSPKLTETKSAS